MLDSKAKKLSRWRKK